MTGLVVKRTSADVGDPARSVCSDDGETVFTFDAPELPASQWTDALGRRRIRAPCARSRHTSTRSPTRSTRSPS